MTDPVRASRVYALNEGVRVFRSGDEIRFRKGIWSYTEANLRLTGQSDAVVRFFNSVYESLVLEREVRVDDIGRELDGSAEDLTLCVEVLESLKGQHYLYDPQQKDVGRVVSALMGGSLSGFEQYVSAPRPVIFYADTEYARSAAKTVAAEIGLPLDVLDDETVRALAGADLTTRTDAVQHAETVAKLGRVFRPYACVMGCASTPNLSLLRNLNRLLILAEKPLILGLIDGPFTSLMATLATQTGCFECYEQRMLARLEDTVVYHHFAESATAARGSDSSWLAPALHMLTAAVVAEGYLYSTLSMMRLAGRIVNTYLPLLEIQVQDLLRVPYCPACGFISTAQMDEMYTSSKRLVGEMLAKVELEDPS